MGCASTSVGGESDSSGGIPLGVGRQLGTTQPIRDGGGGAGGPGADTWHLSEADWPDLLEVWCFINEFHEATGCAVCALRDFAAALAKGSGSHLLASTHIKLLQTVLADMNEAHAAASQLAKTTDEIQGVGAALREAWLWGFDVDAWRAHLNHMTWPEVLRQFATAAGHGTHRTAPLVFDGQSQSADRLDSDELASTGQSQASIAAAMDHRGLLRNAKSGEFVPPRRFQVGGVKAFSWAVLSSTGPEGMSIRSIAGAIARRGFRDLRSCKTPEASLAAALARDPAFVETAPSTYALRQTLNPKP
jgi:hypothetical protein